MKKHIKRICSAVLSASILLSMPVYITSNAVEVSESDDIQIVMTEDENGIRFLGPENESLETFESLSESATVINSISEYYKLAGQSEVQNKYANLKSGTLPDSVDNSDTKYFPAIGNQGDIGSCVSWAQTYYQFTYEMNRSMDVETTPENTFSPKWTHNFANGGKKDGSWEDDVYDLMKEIGNVPLSILPIDDDYLSWSPEEHIWKTSIQYRVSDYQIFKDVGSSDTQITSPDDSDLTIIKTALSNGEVLAYSTLVNSWVLTKLETNAAAPENDKYSGEYVVKYQDGNNGRHRMVLVGYNDNIWTDINDNDQVDSGEMGAFKIANSWDTDYANDGFAWVAYDALNKTSSVSGVTGIEDKFAIFSDVSRIEVVPYDSDASIYLRYTFNSADRSQTKFYITATKDGEEYTIEAGPKRDHGMYNSTYSYDGTTNANDGTMIYPLSNVVPDITSDNLNEYTWSIKFEDTTADGKVFTVKNVEIVDEDTGRVCKPENVFPFTLDGDEKTVAYPQIEDNTETGIIGDANNDGVVNIRDATLIQKYIVDSVDETKILIEASDCNKDDVVNIKDATLIQMYIASYDNVGYVGEAFEYIPNHTDPTEPTEPVTTQPVTIEPVTIEPTTVQPTTVAPTTVAETNKVTFTNSFNWSGTIYCYYWSSSNTTMTSWPGKAMTNAGTNTYGETMYTFIVPDSATYIIFSNGSSQTTDISYIGGEVCYYPLSTTDSSGHYNVATW